MKEVSNLKERLREQRPASWETLPDIPLYMDQVLSLMSSLQFCSVMLAEAPCLV